MIKYIVILNYLLLTNLTFGQQKNTDLEVKTDYSNENQELRDIIQFEGIEYLNIKFTGQELKNKSYQLSVKEIWKGKLVRESIIIDSKTLGIEQFVNVNDTILNIRVISKLTNKNKLKMTFKFPRFSFTQEYDAIKTNEYSLRNLAEESKMDIGYGEKFYLLAYILPYKREDGSKSWCEVGSSGNDIENWGKKFGIKHYLLFEMKFD